MSAEHIHTGPTTIAELIGELERGGAGRPAEIARRLAGDWSETTVVAALAELFSDGIVGHNSDVGLWWIA